MAYAARKDHLRLFSDGLREYHLMVTEQGLMINDLLNKYSPCTEQQTRVLKSTLTKQKPFANGTASAFVCAFGQSNTFALTSIKKYVPSPCHEATVISTGHAQTIYPAF